MKFKTITYSKIKNTGNYENKRLEATIELGPDDNVECELAKLKRWVNRNILNAPKAESNNGCWLHDDSYS